MLLTVSQTGSIIYQTDVNFRWYTRKQKKSSLLALEPNVFYLIQTMLNNSTQNRQVRFNFPPVPKLK